MDRHSSNRCAIYALAGLTADEQVSLFQAAGIFEASQSNYLKEIGAAYAGHPLALQTIARAIASNFQGNAARYWQTCTCDLNNDLSNPRENTAPNHQPANGKPNASLNPHSHHRLLQERLQPALTEAMARLKQQTPDAFELLLASRGYCAEPLTSLTWTQIGQSIGLSAVQSRLLLDLLCDRAFLIPTVRHNRLHFHPHPLIHSLMLGQIQ